MGLSIHYSGRFRGNASLQDMIDEVEDIMKACKWEYFVFEREFPVEKDREDRSENIYGISFSPPECEPVWLCFLSNRRMSGPLNLKLFGNSKDKNEQKYLYMLSVKTQYAGEEIHKFIIELFRYLEKLGYFEKLEITDEGKYWETGDEKLLKNIFKRYTDLLDSFSFALESIAKQKGESYEDYFLRLMNRIKNKNNGEMNE